MLVVFKVSQDLRVQEEAQDGKAWVEKVFLDHLEFQDQKDKEVVLEIPFQDVTAYQEGQGGRVQSF